MKKMHTVGTYSLLLAAGLFLLDRVTKYYALKLCINRCVINPFLSFSVLFNRGISWGMLYSDSTLLFILVSFTIAFVTTGLSWYTYTRLSKNKIIIGELLIIAGSFSNIIDRVFYGGVIDFIELSYHDWMWPVFNIADAGIVCGVFIMLLVHYKN